MKFCLICIFWFFISRHPDMGGVNLLCKETNMRIMVNNPDVLKCFLW